MATRLAAIVGSVVLFGSCATRQTSTLAPDGGADVENVCQPVDEERGQCIRPLDVSLCEATWETRDPPTCGLRVYEGPGAGYLLQYVSYNDIPPLGGPSWMCIYDSTTHKLAGAWALDHYLRWCCQSSLDLFQGVASNDLVNVAVSMAIHPPCPDAGT